MLLTYFHHTIVLKTVVALTYGYAQRNVKSIQRRTCIVGFNQNVYERTTPKRLRTYKLKGHRFALTYLK